ncbi:hypothetical protein D3C85_815670 [compost metagenome]
MVVTEDQCRCVVGQGALDHLSRMNAGVVDGAAEQRLERQYLMPGIEKQATKHLVWLVAQHRFQILANRVRTLQCRLMARTLGQMTPAHFLRSLQLCKFRRPKPQLLAERFLIGLKQQTQAAKLIQQVSRQIYGAFTYHACT